MDARTDARSLALTGLRPLVQAVLGMLGALATHQLAYPLVELIGLDTSANGDHSHLPLQWALVTPLAILGGVFVAVRQLRRLGFASVIRVPPLIGIIGAAFVVQEAIENVSAGGNGIAILSHPAVLLGLALTPLVAWLLVRLLGEVAELAFRWLQRPTIEHPLVGPAPVPIPVRWSESDRRAISRPRAPPRRR